MNTSLTEIVFLLDKSGSMISMGNEPISGFNSFIEDQKDPTLGEAKVTLVLFGSRVETVYSGKDITDVEPLTSNEYVADGMTALLDAIGETFTSVGQRLANTPENQRPGKVVVCILTDGADTCSVKYSANQIKNMIEEQKTKYSWIVEFMGTTADSITSAKSIGLSGALYDNNSVGLASAYVTSSQSLRSVRSSS